MHSCRAPRYLRARSPSAAPRRRAALGIDRFEHRAHESALFLGELGSPRLEEQDHARAVAAVPGFVLDGVVENAGFAFDPLAFLVANAEITAARDDHGQVADEPRIDEAVVRRYGRPGTHHRKED